MINPIAALSPLDGRYAKSVEALRPIFSEYGLMRARVKVELNWLKALAAEPKIVEVPAFSDFTLAEIDKVIENFSLEDAAAVKAIEATTNHDVKAIEYWLKERFSGVPEVAAASEFIHFACTSEDINNLSHALMLQEAREAVLLPKLAEIIEKLTGMAHELGCRPYDEPHAWPACYTKPHWVKKSPMSCTACNVSLETCKLKSSSAKSTAQSATTMPIWSLILMWIGNSLPQLR